MPAEQNYSSFNLKTRLNKGLVLEEIRDSIAIGVYVEEVQMTSKSTHRGLWIPVKYALAELYSYHGAPVTHQDHFLYTLDLVSPGGYLNHAYLSYQVAFSSSIKRYFWEERLCGYYELLLEFTDF